MMKPLVSILTPVYNSEPYLDAFFQSILAQEYNEYELIVVNDGSTDSSEDIIRKYAERFKAIGKRFVYIKQENGGQAKALNAGFPYIRGEYFVWPDSDDILCPDNISAKVTYMISHPEVALGISWAEHIDEQGNHIELLKRAPSNPDNLFIDLLLSRNVQFCPGIYILKTAAFMKCYPNLRIDESRAGQNYQLLLPVAYRYNYGYIDKVLYKYVLHPSSHSNSDLDSEEVQLGRFQEHERLLSRLVEHFCNDQDLSLYLRMIRVHFNELYLRIAHSHRDRKRACNYFGQLVKLGGVSVKDAIYFISSMAGVALKG